ncbi:MAG: RES domain-containing protein [Gammaproteobacteria bacterium]|nr:MAG: RES domain-containing protein [Gammaproteobacteria bacterium]
MRVFRIAAARFARSRKEAFSGQGGLQASARWHTAGQAVVYAAQSLSLAALEILVHLKQTTDLQPFRFFVVEIPDEFILMPASFPARWQNDHRVSRALGDAWLAAGDRPVLRVPSLITPGEWNFLLSPLHRDFTLKWVIAGPSLYRFDHRLLEQN